MNGQQSCRRTRRVRTMVAALLLATGASAPLAAPVVYSFRTSIGTMPGSGGPAALLAGSFVSGTFEYDAQAPATATTSAGMTLYGIQNIPPSFPASFSNLAGSVAGFAFSDARGTTLVGNDNFQLNDFSTNPPTGRMVDFLHMNTQSQTPTAGFSLGGYTLQNVRMFWIEGQQVPETVPDFLGNQNLPGVLPSFHGRLALDFVPTGIPGGAQSFVFYDGLTVAPVPEPETYAMLLAGLAVLGLARRRRAAASPDGGAPAALPAT